MTVRRRTLTLFITALGVGLLMGGCSSGEDPTIEVAFPDGAFAPQTVSVAGLEPGGEVTIRSSMESTSGTSYSAEATFEVPDDGRLALAEDRPVRGDWSTPGAGVTLTALLADGHTRPEDWYQPQTLHLEVTGSGEVLAAADIERPGVAPAVTTEPLDVEGLTGSWILPADWDPQTSNRPGVLAFGGSEGGVAGGEMLGSAVAGLGYPVLAIGYFDVPTGPETLTEVPLETFEQALDVLRERAGVDPDKVFTFGNSRGGEPALWLAAEHPDLVRGAIAPVSAGFFDCSLPRGNSAWTYGGEPVDPSCSDGGVGGPEIDIDAVSGPIVLACGTADPVWDSCEFQQQLLDRAAPEVQDQMVASTNALAGHDIVVPPNTALFGADEPNRTATNAGRIAFWNDVADVLDGAAEGSATS